MYNREEEILEQYDLEIRNTAKGRGALICDTNKGTFLLKSFRGSKERAEFLYGILNFLYKQGFLAEVMYPLDEENILARDEINEIFYCMKTYFPGKECDVKNRDDILAAVKKLAGLHNLTKCYEQGIPEFIKTSQDGLIHEYQRHNRELNKVKNYIRNKHRKNDFEILFMQVYTSYQKQALEVTTQLEQQMAGMKEEVNSQMWGLCHGDYNQHNIVLFQGEWALQNFEQMSYDVQVQDLANFMRKILEKHNWNTGLGMEMIMAYDGVRKLLPEELEQLYLRLAYPHKYWKIANHYYNSRKSWISGRDIEKLQKIMAQEEQRKQFLRMLFHFTSQK
ncbi:MAG: CotS family spore coat protein [Lachnospiraceae bacterium]|nr:CotS family spore coat protein [Lachnospiraceae bacterium]